MFPFSIKQALQVRLLVGELCKTGKLDDMSYTYWDENFTSKCVEALLHPLKLHDPVETKTMTDKFAAVCILQVHTTNTK
jgi:putative Holliday junction resolvase